MDKVVDSYFTTSSSSEYDYREKGSKFLAYQFPVKTISEIELYLEEIRSLHPKASHHCYAYRLGLDGKEYRANDDGEPSGTAGRPILGQLLSFDVSDSLIIVVRYFGGTKLGASGLIQAYKTAAKYALDQVTKTEVILGTDFLLSFDYGEMGHIMNVIKSLDLVIKEKTFDVSPKVIITIRQSKIEETLTLLKAKLLHVSTEQITEETEVPFCDIKAIHHEQ